MEQIKKLFSKETRRGRAVRTFIQALIGVASFFLGLWTLPGFHEAISSLIPEAQVATIAAWVGIVAYIQNALEDLVKYMWGE